MTEGCPQPSSGDFYHLPSEILQRFKAVGSLESSLRGCSSVTARIAGVGEFLEHL